MSPGNDIKHVGGEITTCPCAEASLEQVSLQKNSQLVKGKSLRLQHFYFQQYRQNAKKLLRNMDMVQSDYRDAGIELWRSSEDRQSSCPKWLGLGCTANKGSIVWWNHGRYISFCLVSRILHGIISLKVLRVSPVWLNAMSFLKTALGRAFTFTGEEFSHFP